jgi:hypothetical protein
MKKQADQKCSERKFRVGSMVYMKLQPYIESSILSRANQKLSFKFFGPFRVLEKVSKVAYRLQLPESSSVSGGACVPVMLGCRLQGPGKHSVAF